MSASLPSVVLSIQELVCRYGNVEAVHELSLDITDGSLVCLLGPSGCGKTSVLRSIAGFMPVTSGEIRINDTIVSSSTVTVPPEARNIGMVFQDHALFPHFTVGQNVSAGLHRKSDSERHRIVDELLERVGLEGYADRYPHELSGGQQQRVAIARALAPDPALLLMDEPFSNLDLELRERLGNEVRELLKERGTTCVLVTHDQNDAFALGEFVGTMNEGTLVQWDTPYNLYHEPASRFVAEFVGDGTLIPGVLQSPERVQTEFGNHTSHRRWDFGDGADVEVLIRPDDVVHDETSNLRATVRRKAFKGAQILYTLTMPSGRTVLSLLPSHSNFDVGDTLGISLAADHLVVFAI